MLFTQNLKCGAKIDADASGSGFGRWLQPTHAGPCQRTHSCVIHCWIMFVQGRPIIDLQMLNPAIQ